MALGGSSSGAVPQSSGSHILRARGGASGVDGAMGGGIAPNTTDYYPVSGNSAGHGAEATIHQRFLQGLTAAGAYAYVSANTLSTAAAVLTLRDDGADTALAVSIPAGTTGLVALTGGPVAIAAGSLLAWKLAVAAGGTGTISLSIIELDVGV